MKIDKRVIEQYRIQCPTSTSKCSSEDEIKYKIERAVTLGKVVDIREDGYHIQYHYNIFIVKNKRIIVLYESNSKDRYIRVSERVKQKYDLIHSKVLV